MSARQDGSALSPETKKYIAMRERGERLPSRRDLQRQLMECEDALRATEAALAALPPSTPPAGWTDPGITTPNPDGTVTWQPTPDGFSGGKVKPKPPKMPPSAPPALDVGRLRDAIDNHVPQCEYDACFGQCAEPIAAEYARLQEQDH